MKPLLSVLIPSFKEGSLILLTLKSWSSEAKIASSAMKDMKDFVLKMLSKNLGPISFYFHNFFFRNVSTVISLQFREKGNKSTIIIVLKTFKTFKFPTQKGNSSLQTITLQFSLFSSCGEELYSSLELVKNSKVTYLLSSCLWFYIQGSLVKPIRRSVAEESLFVACL